MSNTIASRVVFEKTASFERIEINGIKIDSKDVGHNKEAITIQRTATLHSGQEVVFSPFNFDSKKKKDAYRRINNQLREG